MKVNYVSSPWNAKIQPAQVHEAKVDTEPTSAQAGPARKALGRKIGSAVMSGLSLVGSLVGVSRTARADSISSTQSPPDSANGKAAADETNPDSRSTDEFLRTWLQGEFDQNLPMSDRLTRATRVAPSPETIFPTTTSDGSIAPPLSTLSKVTSFQNLSSQVNNFYGANNPGVDAVALAMGASYANNYATGAGGAYSPNTNAFDLFNKQSGVCVQIHEAIAAYRQAQGQEAYVVGSSAVSNPHTFLIFKENGHWNIQNYGSVVSTNATTLQQLFATAMPEETRPLLYKVQPDGTMQRVGSNFVTPTGQADRRFTDQAGTGFYDPFYDRGVGMRYDGGTFTLWDQGAHLSMDATGQQLAGGYMYRLDLDNPHDQTVAGLSAQADLANQDYKLKWEIENRWQDSDAYGRQRLAIFGEAQLGVPSPQYWGPITDYKIGEVGGELDRYSSKLHGSGPLRLETSYDVTLRGAWTYGLDGATRSAFTSAQNGTTPAKYVGDFNHMQGDSTAATGVSTGFFYKPDPSLQLRAGVRLGADFANWDAGGNVAEGLKDSLAPSAYADLSFKKDGMVVKAMTDVPILQPDTYRLAAAVAYSPNTSCTLGVSYSHQQIMLESSDQVQVGAGCKLGAGVTAQVGVNVTDLAAGAGPQTALSGGLTWTPGTK